ncbi:MAG: hypothetical protein E6K59_01740 [Nitrospirae bacterium]|nr:MAG: hypothetical protein E6K59_01740 [Nitrospirota bacterium]
MRQKAFITVLVVSAACVLPSAGLDAAGNNPVLKEIQNTEEYFPDEIGSVWRYHGRTHTDTVAQAGEVTFSNEVSAIGTTNIKGETVKIFRETNQGNKGPTDGFFRRDKTGITYYGSQPTTPFEQQLVPYRVLAFPLVMNGTFRQLEKRGVDMQADLDGDGSHERADVVADVRVVAHTPVTVPAGTFNDAVQIDASMTIVISLTKDRRVITSRDRITSWFARGVGLVKYVEEIEAPPVLETRGEVTYVSEELESYALKGTVERGL